MRYYPHLSLILGLILVLSLGCRRNTAASVNGPVHPPRLGEPSADVLAWFARGIAAEAYGDVAEAERAYRWVVRLEPGRPEAHEVLARFYHEQGRFEASRAGWLRSLELDATRWWAHVGLYRIAVNLGEDGAAEHHRREAIGLGGDAARTALGEG